MNRYDILVSELCEEIDILKNRLIDVEERAKQYQDKYVALLNDSISHGQIMMNMTISELLKPSQTNGGQK